MEFTQKTVLILEKKTNSNLSIIGINHAELNSYGVSKEWVLFDEVAIWKQILMNKNKNG